MKANLLVCDDVAVGDNFVCQHCRIADGTLEVRATTIEDDILTRRTRVFLEE